MLHWDELKRLPVPPRVVTGYVAGLAAASLAFWLVPAIGIPVADFVAGTVAVDDAPTSPVLWLIIAIMGTLVSLTLIFPFAVPLTFIPFIFVYLTSVFLRINNVLYFVFSGAVVGYLIPTILWGTRSGRDSLVPGQWAAMSVCGAIGGLVYWWVAVRHGSTAEAAPAQERP